MVMGHLNVLLALENGIDAEVLTVAVVAPKVRLTPGEAAFQAEILTEAAVLQVASENP